MKLASNSSTCVLLNVLGTIAARTMTYISAQPSIDKLWPYRDIDSNFGRQLLAAS